MDTATCSCPNCAQHIAFDVANIGAVAPCPNCERDVKLTPTIPATLMESMSQISAAAPAAPAKPSISTKSGVKEYLNRVRAESCYKVLRSCIRIAFALFMVGVVLGIIVAAIGGLVTHEQPLVVFASICAAVLVLVLLIAAMQASLLLIDIADTLIHHHHRTENEA